MLRCVITTFGDIKASDKSHDLSVLTPIGHLTVAHDGLLHAQVERLQRLSWMRSA